MKSTRERNSDFEDISSAQGSPILDPGDGTFLDSFPSHLSKLTLVSKFDKFRSTWTPKQTSNQPRLSFVEREP